MESLLVAYSYLKSKLFYFISKQFNKKYKLEKLTNEAGNEMWRLCWKGYNKNRWFVRLDWGSKGWRITKR